MPATTRFLTLAAAGLLALAALPAIAAQDGPGGHGPGDHSGPPPCGEDHSCPPPPCNPDHPCPPPCHDAGDGAGANGTDDHPCRPPPCHDAGANATADHPCRPCAAGAANDTAGRPCPPPCHPDMGANATSDRPCMPPPCPPMRHEGRDGRDDGGDGAGGNATPPPPSDNASAPPHPCHPPCPEASPGAGADHDARGSCGCGMPPRDRPDGMRPGPDGNRTMRPNGTDGHHPMMPPCPPPPCPPEHPEGADGRGHGPHDGANGTRPPRPAGNATMRGNATDPFRLGRGCRDHPGDPHDARMMAGRRDHALQDAITVLSGEVDRLGTLANETSAEIAASTDANATAHLQDRLHRIQRLEDLLIGHILDLEEQLAHLESRWADA